MKAAREVPGPHTLLKIIENSKIPLGEEETRLQSIRGKLDRDAELSRDDEHFLAGLAERANEWQRGTKSSEATETADTMSG
jgi:hypothetical protein